MGKSKRTPAKPEPSAIKSPPKKLSSSSLPSLTTVANKGDSTSKKRQLAALEIGSSDDMKSDENYSNDEEYQQFREREELKAGRKSGKKKPRGKSTLHRELSSAEVSTEEVGGKEVEEQNQVEEGGDEHNWLTFEAGEEDAQEQEDESNNVEEFVQQTKSKGKGRNTKDSDENDADDEEGSKIGKNKTTRKADRRKEKDNIEEEEQDDDEKERSRRRKAKGKGRREVQNAENEDEEEAIEEVEDIEKEAKENQNKQRGKGKGRAKKEDEDVDQVYSVMLTDKQNSRCKAIDRKRGSPGIAKPDITKEVYIPAWLPDEYPTAFREV